MSISKKNIFRKIKRAQMGIENMRTADRPTYTSDKKIAGSQ